MENSTDTMSLTDTPYDKKRAQLLAEYEHLRTTDPSWSDVRLQSFLDLKHDLRLEHIAVMRDREHYPAMKRFEADRAAGLYQA